MLPISQITFYPVDNCYGEVYCEICKTDNRYVPFLVLNPEYFNKGIKHIVEILIHEMVHIYCFVYGINEINFKTGYHNKNFKKICDKIGVTCRKTTEGFNDVTLGINLTSELNDIIDNKYLVQLLKKYNYK